LTGHLVLSTLHTNTAIGAVTRLKDMGIEPFLLSSSLIGVIAQRLVRTLCSHCVTWREADTFETQLFKHLNPKAELQLPQPNGCEHCSHTGFT
ncbi:ATPase, T2SS/T4P/T4SS family, partial [Acinetobacter johnsonii]|uniref:ATPase, T2SS/T4P/T4SS family n=1 Tax=Acinetobacter johnsonii TaxID=40214 RepID=UPI003AF7343B